MQTRKFKENQRERRERDVENEIERPVSPILKYEMVPSIRYYAVLRATLVRVRLVRVGYVVRELVRLVGHLVEDGADGAGCG